MSSWNVNNEKTIKFIKDGVTKDYKFPVETKLKEAIQKIASDNSLTAVNVYEKQSNGEMVDIDSDEGNTTLADFNELQVSCKAQGAKN
jgi:hypothetical protein